MTFDEIRQEYPGLALNLYAMTPGGVVTLEIIDGSGAIYTFTGATEAEALAAAFPDPGPIAPPENVFD